MVKATLSMGKLVASTLKLKIYTNLEIGYEHSCRTSFLYEYITRNLLLRDIG